MKRALQKHLATLCLFLGLAAPHVHARESVCTAIQPNALGFAVVHNLADASHTIDELAKLLQLPAPNVITLTKGLTGLQKGIDEAGDVAVFYTDHDPLPQSVVLVPVSNFADFFAALNVPEPASGLAEVQLLGAPALVGRKGDYAAIARPDDRDALEKLLASTTSPAADASLSAWLDANKASLVVTSLGIKAIAAKLHGFSKAAEESRRQHPEEKPQPQLDVAKFYADLVATAEPEVDEYALGLHVDSIQNIDLVNRIRFKPAGAWAQWAASTKPGTEDLLSGLPAGRFVMAFGGAVPPGAADKMLALFTQMMKNNPALKLAPEDAQKYAELSTSMSRGLRSMRMFLGTAEPGAGLYSNSVTIMTFDDTHGYLDRYEKSLAALHEFAEKLQNPMIPAATTQRIAVGDIEALEVTMSVPDFPPSTQPGAPDPAKMRQMLFGADAALKLYVAPADDHAVVIAYTSPDLLKSALERYKSEQPGLSSDARVRTVAAMLPPESQAIGFFDLGGALALGQQFATTLPFPRAITFPDLVPSPPVGMAATVTSDGIQSHLVITAESLQSIGDAIAKVRGAAAGAR